MASHASRLNNAINALLESLQADIANGVKLGEQTLLDIKSCEDAVEEYENN